MSDTLARAPASGSRADARDEWLLRRLETLTKVEALMLKHASEASARLAVMTELYVDARESRRQMRLVRRVWRLYARQSQADHHAETIRHLRELYVLARDSGDLATAEKVLGRLGAAIGVDTTVPVRFAARLNKDGSAEVAGQIPASYRTEFVVLDSRERRRPIETLPTIAIEADAERDD